MKFLKVFGLFIAGVLVVSVIMALFSDEEPVEETVVNKQQEEKPKEDKKIKLDLENYKEVDTSKENDMVTVELAKDKNMANVDYWIMGFAQNAVVALEEHFKDEDVQKVRIFENSTFTDKNGKEKEDVLFDVTVTRDVAAQWDYDNFKSIAFTEPYQLFNKGETYYIHVGMFMKELSPELRSGFESSFEKK